LNLNPHSLRNNGNDPFDSVAMRSLTKVRDNGSGWRQGRKRGSWHSGSDAAPLFERKKRVLGKVALPVQVFVIFALSFSIFSWRDHRLYALRSRLFNDGIAVVTSVGDQVLGRDASNESLSLCAVCSGSFRSNDSDRHTMRIHGQMYLGVEPPFVRLIP